MWLSIACLLFLVKGMDSTSFLYFQYFHYCYLVCLMTLVLSILVFHHFYFTFIFRISITFRRMDESKRPRGYVPEPDLQGLEPVFYETDSRPRVSNSPKPERPINRQAVRTEGGMEAKGFMGRGHRSGPHYSSRLLRGPANRRRVRPHQS